MVTFLGLFGLSAFNVAEAKSDFFDKFYVRGNAYVGYNYNLSNYSMVGVRNNITNAANNGNEQFKAFKDIASK